MPDIPLTISQAPAGGGALTPDQVTFLVATAGRAPSVHNTQPWQFRVHENGLDLLADQGRRLRTIDPDGREMLVSCGGALFGLRLGLRHLGYQATVELLPDPGHPSLLARVRLGRRAPLTPEEWDMLAAVPHRHTHRGPFSPEPLPAGLLPRLQHDAIAEGATLVLVDQRSQGRLRDLVEAAARWQQRNPVIGDELREWTGARGSDTRDGVPPSAYPARTSGQPDTPAGWDGVLTRRDFDQGRGEGQLETGGAPLGHRHPGHRGRHADRLAAGRAGAEPGAGARRERMGVRRAEQSAHGVAAAAGAGPVPALPAGRSADAAPVRPGAYRRAHRAPARRRVAPLTSAQDPGQLGGGPGRPGARRGQPGGRGVQHFRGPGLQLDLHLPPGVLLPPAVRVCRVRP